MNNIILDTNIFLRFLIKSNDQQFLAVRELFRKVIEGKIRATVSLLVINELIWVAENYYSLNRKEYLESVIALLAHKNFICFEVKKNELIDLLEVFKKSHYDFTDVYLSFILKKGQSIASFDHDFKKMQVNIYQGIS